MDNPTNTFGYLLLILFSKSVNCDDEVCNLVPLGIKTSALPPDDRYYIDIENIKSEYIPGKTYKVFLKSRSDNAKFIAFTISVSGDTEYNPDLPRKPKVYLPGTIKPNDDQAKSGENCLNTVIHKDIMPKTSVEALWKAPPKDNGCVTIFALVAIKSDVYYSDKGPLSRRICEDRRKLEDMLPEVNPKCEVCKDAKYKLTFQGLWSFNTHLELYPRSSDSTTNQASFGDIVGASHNKNYTLFKSHDEANLGMRMLAEQGNTTKLEMDMQERIGQSIRTIIKATSPATTTSTASALFRVSQEHHLVSLVTAIMPSPDWFLGASNIELCVVNRNEWAPNLTLNLYPLDAGVDKGTDFNSANDNMMPPQPITRTSFPGVSNDKVKPFARIYLNLIHTYDLTPGCFEKDESGGEDGIWETSDGGAGGDGNDSQERSPPTTTSTTEAPIVTDPDSTSDCPMTAWEEWLPCEGNCEDGKRAGMHSRFRYHIVDGVPVKYSNEGSQDKEIPQECFENNEEHEFEMCEEDCEEPTTATPETAQRQVAWRRFWNI